MAFPGFDRRPVGGCLTGRGCREFRHGPKRRAVRESPDNLPVSVGLARVYLEEGKAEEAEREARAARDHNGGERIICLLPISRMCCSFNRNSLASVT